MNERRELGAAVLGGVVAGALALSAGGQPWAEVTAERRPPLPPVTDVLTGSEAAPLVPAAGLVLLAAAVALFAVRGYGRTVVGLLMAAAGGVLAWSGLRGVTGRFELGDAPSAVGLDHTTLITDAMAGWAALALVAGLLGMAAGLLVVLRGRAWPAMGRRYERDGAAAPPSAERRPQTDEDRTQAAWKALDQGLDPTADPTDPRAAGPGHPAR